MGGKWAFLGRVFALLYFALLAFLANASTHPSIPSTQIQQTQKIKIAYMYIYPTENNTSIQKANISEKTH